ncbi:MAG: hypothetical protein DRJ52_10710 [Thermoprotei archaeon]|nr:MAG: hypothetical protein DRJ52_10710 [Thermoprotei archaeon]
MRREARSETLIASKRYKDILRRYRLQDIVAALTLILGGAEKGLYPASRVCAGDASKLGLQYSVSVVGRGLSALEKLGFLTRVNSGSGRKKYRLAKPLCELERFLEELLPVLVDRRLDGGTRVLFFRVGSRIVVVEMRRHRNTVLVTVDKSGPVPLGRLPELLLELGLPQLRGRVVSEARLILYS